MGKIAKRLVVSILIVTASMGLVVFHNKMKNDLEDTLLRLALLFEDLEDRKYR